MSISTPCVSTRLRFWSGWLSAGAALSWSRAAMSYERRRPTRNFRLASRPACAKSLFNERAHILPPIWSLSRSLSATALTRAVAAGALASARRGRSQSCNANRGLSRRLFGGAFAGGTPTQTPPALMTNRRRNLGQFPLVERNLGQARQIPTCSDSFLFEVGMLVGPGKHEHLV